MTTILVLLCILLINILFGYWRANTRKFSIQWIMAIHVPVLIAIGIRLSLLGWSWVLVPAFVATFAAGQYTGGIIRHQLTRQRQMRPSSFLVIDLVRAFSATRRVLD